MKYQLPFYFVLLLITCYSCGINLGKQNQVKIEKLYGTWIVADVKEMRPDIPEGASKEKLDQSVELAEALEKELRMSMLKTGPALSLFADGKYTLLTEESYETGDWTLLEGNTIAFDPLKTKSSYQQKIEWEGDELLAFEVKERNYQYKLVMRYTAATLAQPEADPFHPSKNAWRIKPIEPESSAQIRARMRNHLQHYHSILTAASERKAKVVSFERSPSCIQIYNGGIGLKKDSQIDAVFINRVGRMGMI
jgi:hypothetical protein